MLTLWCRVPEIKALIVWDTDCEPEHLKDEQIFCRAKNLFALLCQSVLVTDGFEAFTHWIKNRMNHSYESFGCQMVRLLRPSATLRRRWLVGQFGVVLGGPKSVIWEDRVASTGRPVSSSCVSSLRETSWLSVRERWCRMVGRWPL